jgi:hypothetical protein
MDSEQTTADREPAVVGVGLTDLLGVVHTSDANEEEMKVSQEHSALKFSEEDMNGSEKTQNRNMDELKVEFGIPDDVYGLLMMDCPTAVSEVTKIA